MLGQNQLSHTKEPRVIQSSGTPAISGTLIRHPDFPSRFVEPRNVDVWLPPGYSSGEPISQQYTVVDDSFSELGISAGEYLTYSWDGPYGDSITFVAIPEPAALALVIFGLVWSMGWRHQRQLAASDSPMSAQLWPPRQP